MKNLYIYKYIYINGLTKYYNNQLVLTILGEIMNNYLKLPNRTIKQEIFCKHLKKSKILFLISVYTFFSYM